MIFNIYLHELPSYDARAAAGEFEILNCTRKENCYVLCVKETPGVKIVNNILRAGIAEDESGRTAVAGHCQHDSGGSTPPPAPISAPSEEREPFSCPTCRSRYMFDDHPNGCPCCAATERERLEILHRIGKAAEARRAEWHDYKRGLTPKPL